MKLWNYYWSYWKHNFIVFPITSIVGQWNTVELCNVFSYKPNWCQYLVINNVTVVVIANVIISLSHIVWILHLCLQKGQISLWSLVWYLSREQHLLGLWYNNLWFQKKLYWNVFYASPFISYWTFVFSKEGTIQV